MVELFMMTIEEAKKLPQSFAELHFPERLAKAKSFAFESDYLRSIGAGYLLYSILGLESKDIYYKENGKPLSEKTDKGFNLSHSGDYIILATGEGAIGADIEKLGEYKSGVAKRIFTDEELAYISEAPEERFYLLWSLKESASKAIGKGINFDFKLFNALPLLHGKAIKIDNAELFGKAFIYNGYSVAVCSQRTVRKIKMQKIEISAHEKC